jgi:hypothetical protein
LLESPVFHYVETRIEILKWPDCDRQIYRLERAGVAIEGVLPEVQGRFATHPSLENATTTVIPEYLTVNVKRI